MPKVYNKRGEYPADAVYVGRPSYWGNPFIIGRDGDREEVVKRYRGALEFQLKNPMYREMFNEKIKELVGKDLVCWCAPLACHADILLEYARIVQWQDNRPISDLW